VRSKYKNEDQMYIFWNALQVNPPSTPTALAANSPATLTVARTGSLVLKETSTYTFTFSLTTALTANSDWLLIEFPSHAYELDADYSGVTVAITSPARTSKSYIINRQNRIYVYPTQAVGAGATTITVSNLPNPSYYLGETLSFSVKSIVNKKTKDVFNADFQVDTTVCTLFSNISIVYTSQYLRINENTYKVSFVVDHDVPGDGSLAVVFDSSLYALRPANPQCSLIKGFPSSATCHHELFAQQLIRISLNGQPITAGTEVELDILNVNNPTDSSITPVMKIQSYFDAAEGSTKVICSSNHTLPNFKDNAIIGCPITVAPDFQNSGLTTDFLVTLKCSEFIRNNTQIIIDFPPEVPGFESTLSCSTNGNYMLEPCEFVTRTNGISLLVLKPNIQDPLVVRIRGVKMPSTVGTYSPIQVSLKQYGVLYAQTDIPNSVTSFTSAPNTNLVQMANHVSLSAFPMNYAEKATYFINLVGVKAKTETTKLFVIFDTAFTRDLGQQLLCGTFIPDPIFGSSYALNFEVMKGLRDFPCSLHDDYTLFVDLSSSPISANTLVDFFFFVRNVYNPNEGSKSTFSFKFKLVTSTNTIALISENAVTLTYGATPSLLRVSSVETTDNNLGAPAEYTFTLNSTASLPAAISTIDKDYEIVLILPADKYPDFTNHQSSIVYNFTSLDYLNTGSAFNFQNSLFFYAQYPDLATISPFQLVLKNVTNPVVPSVCGLNAEGEPIKFQVQYVSRKTGLVYGKSYDAMDDQNCLPVGKYRFSIKVIAPTFTRRGLVYPITVEVEAPAADLQLIPYSTFVIFEPKTINFTDFQNNVATVNMIVPENIDTGDYVIRWIKVETGIETKYLEVPDTVFKVIDSSSIVPKPQVNIEDFKYVWTGTLARDVTVTLDQDPATSVTLNIDLRLSDSNLKGSVDRVTYSNFPISLTFNRGEKQKTFYISAGKSAKANALTYSLSGTNAGNYDQVIPETAFLVMPADGQPEFLMYSAIIQSIQENSASIKVSLSGLGTIYYLAYVDSSLISVTNENIIRGTVPNIDPKWYKSGSVKVEQLADDQSYSKIIDISGLFSQTKYRIHFIARSSFGSYSRVITFDFTTLKVSPGVNLRIPTVAEIDPDHLVESLSNVLALPKSRVIFKSAETFTVERRDDPFYGTDINDYVIIIAPDPASNDPTPTQIVQGFNSNAEKLTRFSILVPEFYNKAGIRVTPVKANTPRVITGPKVLTRSYYTVSISIELIERGRVFAIATERSKVGDTVPGSYQIAHGLLADGTQSQDRYQVSAWTDQEGRGVIVFDELKEYTEYNIYITASNEIPYEPTDLLTDSEVMSLRVKTLKNPSKFLVDFSLFF